MTPELLHHHLVRGLLEKHVCPGASDLRAALGVEAGELDKLYDGLAAIHGVVLHPHAKEPWVLHPFSLTPTMHWVEKEDGSGWWAPCVWCAMGVAALAGGRVKIHTRWGAESEPALITVQDGEPLEPNGIHVHFAIPPSKAWQNVHQHCSLVLPFRTKAHLEAWCLRHGIPQGEAVPLAQVARLARIWYGRHADRDWRKWSVAEAQDIFHAVGLTSPFWDLGVQAGRF